MIATETSKSSGAAPTAVIAIAVGNSDKGGRNALIKLLAPLPADFSSVILVAMHLEAEDQTGLLASLSASTVLACRTARSGDRIVAGTVFIAPPNYHLLVTALGVLWLSVEPAVHTERPAADPLFRSVAEVYADRAIGIVLTGGDSDGAAGIQAIKRAGGRTVAQSEASSENPDMPRSAIATGRVDRVVPLAEIADALQQMVTERSFA